MQVVSDAYSENVKYVKDGVSLKVVDQKKTFLSFL